MPPATATFPAHQLPSEVQTTYNRKYDTQMTRRKGNVELKKCELLEMLQYECGVERLAGRESVSRESRVVCRPVERLFRKCQDRNGKFMVETTAWEGLEDGKS